MPKSQAKSLKNRNLDKLRESLLEKPGMSKSIILTPKTTTHARRINFSTLAVYHPCATVPRAADQVIAKSTWTQKRRIRLKRVLPSKICKVLGLLIQQKPSQDIPFMLLSVQSEHLEHARFVAPTSVVLRFADKTFSLAVELLGMPVDRILWKTVTASPTGEAMTVKGVKGEKIPIDSSTLRYLVDPKYAAKIDAKLKLLQFSRAELEELACSNPPPDELFTQPERDLTSDSWK